MPAKAPVFRPPGSKKIRSIDRSPDAAERQRLYATAGWHRLRRAHLQGNPLCVECEAPGLIVIATVVDHKLSHHVGAWRDRFFDPDALQSLCLTCHNQKSAREIPRAT